MKKYNSRPIIESNLYGKKIKLPYEPYTPFRRTLAKSHKQNNPEVDKVILKSVIDYLKKRNIKYFVTKSKETFNLFVEGPKLTWWETNKIINGMKF